jgi:multidrug resistance protein, MATE family
VNVVGLEVQQPSTRRIVWRMAWPTIAEQCLNLTVGLNEVFLIGHLSQEASSRLGYDSALALAATNLGQFFNWVLLAAFNGVGTAATALVAHSIGARQRSQATDYARQSLIMALGVGLLMAVTLHVNAPWLLWLLGAEGQLHEIGLTFVYTASFGMIGFAVMVAGNACLRGSGDTRTPLLIMLIVNATNIAVAWVFINGNFGLPTLGVQGAALGAVISWSVGAILVLARLLWGMPIGRAPRFLRVQLRWRLDRTMVRQLLNLALPTIGEQWAFQFGLFFFARMLVTQGTLTYAAHNAVLNIDSISFLPGIGLGIANTVLVGQSLGSGQPEQARLYALSAYKMGLVFMTLMGLSFVLFPEFFLSLLIGNQDIVTAAVPALQIAGLFDPVIATSFILTGALRGAGDTRFPLYARMLSTIVVRVSLAFLFLEVLNLGLIGGRLAMGVDAVLLASLVLWRFNSGKWQTIWRNQIDRKDKTIEPPVALVE